MNDSQNIEFDDYDKAKELLRTKSLEMDPVEFISYLFSNWDGLFDNPSEESPLLLYLNDRVSMLGQDEKTRIYEDVKKYIESEDDNIRGAVAKCLGFVCDQDLSLLDKLLQDPDCIVRCEVVESMLRLKGVKIADKVIEIFRNDEDVLVRYCAIAQLSYLDGFKKTDLFVEALDSDSAEIFSICCKYLAKQKNRGVYKILRRKYIRSSCRFEKICLSYALFMHGERDKLKKICKALTAPGEEGFWVRLEAAMFLDYIYWQSDYKTRRIALDTIKRAIPEETVPRIIEELTISLKKMEPDMKNYFNQKGENSFLKSSPPG